jgi:hypothetical protein
MTASLWFGCGVFIILAMFLFYKQYPKDRFFETMMGILCVLVAIWFALMAFNQT